MDEIEAIRERDRRIETMPLDHRLMDAKKELAKERYEAAEAKRISVSDYCRQVLYGITPEEYQKLVDEQNGVCKICSGTDSGRPLSVDHCHKTKRIRGLLCTRCNLGLGYFKDEPERLRRAAEYLE